MSARILGLSIPALMAIGVGLVVAVVQEVSTREVLMVAYMNTEALRRTLETGRGDREANMWAFTRAALELLDACLEQAGDQS